MNPTLRLALTLALLIAAGMPLGAGTIIDRGSANWSYLHVTDGTDPAIADADFNTTWLNPTTGGYTGVAYDGPSFTSAATAPFHYGGVDGLAGGTTLAAPAVGNRYTAYFYKLIDGANGYRDLQLSLLADDGAYVYLNGELIASSNVSGSDTFTTFANSAANETTWNDLVLLGEPMLRPGLNLLAISVHQRSTDSSDLGFDLEISGTPILASTAMGGWSMLSPINAGNGYDPASIDPDFNSTWQRQSLGGYTGGAYDGPAFTPSLTGPFAYGGVVGIPDVGTAIPQPALGTRGSAYFIREVDGGASGYDGITIRTLADDGAYIYLNGSLVAVVGDLPADPAFDTWGQQTGADSTEVSVEEVTLEGDQLLQPGPNLLAVSLHNTAATSSDLGFALELAAHEPELPQIVRGPYLQSAAHDRITLRWRTHVPGDTVVRYGDAPANLTQTVTIAGPTTEHVAPLTGLAPETTYYYRIETTNTQGTAGAGGNGSADYRFRTHPLPGSRTPARIWVIGDSGTVSAAKQAVYDAYRSQTGAADTDLWLMLGDNAYSSGTDAEFQAAVFDAYPELLRNTPLWSCIGNHEAITLLGQPYLDLHSFPTAGESGGVPSGSERYYSFDFGNIHFISIDSQTSGNYNDVPGGGGMVDWLELDLQATAADWIIAFMHHGPYTKGSHDSDVESHHIAMRQYVTPLLEKYGVDLVLSGHSHCYERSMLLNGHHSNLSTADSTSGTFNPAIHVVDPGNGSSVGTVDAVGDFTADGGDGDYHKPLAAGEAGTVYSTCGASGQISAWNDGSTAVVNPNPHPVFIVSLRVMGSLILEIEDNTLHARYLDGSNVVRDDFSLVKGSLVQINALDPTFGEVGADDSASFTLTRQGATSLAESVAYAVGGTAGNGSDFTPSLGGVAAFGAGDAQHDITVVRTVDHIAEGPESLDLTLLAPTTTVAGGSGQRSLYYVGSSRSDRATLLDAPSQDWWFDAFGPATLTPADWELDTDGDGLTRLEELAYGGNEGISNTTLGPTLSTAPGSLELHYRRNNAVPELRVLARRSSDLSIWDDTDIVHILDGPANPTGIEFWKAVTGTDPPSGFLRLELNLNLDPDPDPISAE